MPEALAWGVLLIGMGAYWLPEWAEGLVRRRISDRFVQTFYRRMNATAERLLFTYARIGGMLLHTASASWLIQQPFTLLYKLTFMIFLLLLNLVILTDLMAWLIPNSVTYSGTLLSASYCLLEHREAFMSIGLAALGIYAAGYLIWRRTGGIGMGDIKLLSMSVWLLGLDLFFAVWLSSVSALCTVAARAVVQGRWTSYSPFPYGPHLAVGMMVMLFWGDRVNRWIGL